MTRMTNGSVCFALLAFLSTAPLAHAAGDSPAAGTSALQSGPIAAPYAAPQVQLPPKMLNPTTSQTAPNLSPNGPVTSDWKALQAKPSPLVPAPVATPTGSNEPAQVYSASRPALPADPTPTAKPATSVEVPTPSNLAAATAVSPAPYSAPNDSARARTLSQPTAKASAPDVAVAAPPAAPVKPQITLAIDIDLTRQRMTVAENGQQVGSWAISSGREGYRSPTGSYRPLWSSKMWFSKKYDNAPMPHAVFFSGGVAMHATQATGMLGHPASHGCIRQSPANAATTFRLVAKHGNAHTKITVHGTPRDSEPRVANRDRSQQAVRIASRENRSVDRHSQMRRVILVDGDGQRRIAEIPANDPRLVNYQNRQQSGRNFW